ncbi:hypothetical protein ISN76_07595 [Dyella halodurans]|uniref:Glycosyl hydrolase family 28-related protein n=1 Tax=Dyella halodurans TaxID=1920171 RepID=A0ABV9C3Q8_9GAMM|nr:glycosyl hydrolase family 28-related protein [Dyella halodurans]
MERRQFIGSIPLAVGGALIALPTQASAQSSSPSTIWTNVKTFGAVGDGVTDDTSAILAAIATPQQNNDFREGVLYFPAGQYKCSSTLAFTAYSAGVVHNIIVRGDGPQCTYLDFSSASTGSSGIAFNAGA